MKKHLFFILFPCLPHILAQMSTGKAYAGSNTNGVFSLQYFSQTNEELFREAVELRNLHKDKESLPLFEKLLKSDSNNVSYLTNVSNCYSIAGNEKKDEKERMKYFNSAAYLSEKAIKLNPEDADAHYTYAQALGRINEFASPKQQVASAKVIKTETEKAITLDPKISGAHHIMGRWHRTVAGFGPVEKLAINMLFGGVPEGGSYEAAVESFQKAIKVEPKYILHIYELANTYYEMKNIPFAKAWLKKAMEISPGCADDADALKKCEELKKKLN